MKTIINTLLLISLFSFSAISQDCEGVVIVCKANLNKGNSSFISDGQVYTAFLDREKAEFKTTFFGGSTYRIATSAGSTDDFVIFTVRDLQGNVIFTNKDFKNSPYWDFKVFSYRRQRFIFASKRIREKQKSSCYGRNQWFENKKCH